MVGEPIPSVVEARHAGGYRVWLRFDDGTEGELDLEAQLWGPVFEPLKDIEQFKRFTVDLDTITWPTGADLDPEVLHERVRRANELKNPAA